MNFCSSDLQSCCQNLHFCWQNVILLLLAKRLCCQQNEITVTKKSYTNFAARETKSLSPKNLTQNLQSPKYHKTFLLSQKHGCLPMMQSRPDGGFSKSLQIVL